MLSIGSDIAPRKHMQTASELACLRRIISRLSFGISQVVFILFLIFGQETHPCRIVVDMNAQGTAEPITRFYIFKMKEFFRRKIYRSPAASLTYAVSP